jgi:hypothetical protein
VSLKMEGVASDKNTAFMLQEYRADGLYYHLNLGIPQTTPIISGEMKSLRLPTFFEKFWATPTSFDGAFGHKDGPKQGASLAVRAGSLGCSGRLANSATSPFDGVIEPRRRMRKSRVSSSHSRKMLTSSTLNERTCLATSASHLCRPPLSIGRGRQQRRLSSTPPLARKKSAMTRHVLGQSSRHADLSLYEEQLIRNGKLYSSPPS